MCGVGLFFFGGGKREFFEAWEAFDIKNISYSKEYGRYFLVLFFTLLLERTPRQQSERKWHTTLFILHSLPPAPYPRAKPPSPTLTEKWRKGREGRKGAHVACTNGGREAAGGTG